MARPIALAGLLLAACSQPLDSTANANVSSNATVQANANATVQANANAALQANANANEDDQAREPLEGTQGPPVSLTASDGTGLKIASLDVRAVIQDPLAFTELHLVFRNPEPRQIEGQFEVTLPPGAAVSRFAMKQSWGWQEGEVVELQAARRAYEDFLHRRQDPALLEKQAGNQFHARVFPIPPSGLKEIILSYSQELTHTGDPFRVQLRGLPLVEALHVRAQVGKRVVELDKRDVAPDADFEVPLDNAGAQVQPGLRHENLVVARITPFTDATPEPLGDLLVLFDTSASRALGFGGDVARLARVIAAIGKRTGQQMRLGVACFDQDVEPIFDGPIAAFGEQEQRKILARRALGASDLGRALAFAAREKFSRVLLVTDGVATAGPTEGAALRAATQALARSGVRRLDALVVGGIREPALLKQLATAGLPRDGAVLDGALPAGAIARRLASATLSGVKVTVPGAAWVWPEQLDGLQPGDQVLLYADLPPSQPLTVELTGAGTWTHPVQLTEVERPLVERAWVGARIAKLQHERDAADVKENATRAQLKHQIVELSTRFRVLCDFTALLVLESESDYARFHIDRRALSNILVVGERGVELLDRRQVPPPLAHAPRAKKVSQPDKTNFKDTDGESEVAEKKKTGGKRNDELDDLLNSPKEEERKTVHESERRVNMSITSAPPPAPVVAAPRPAEPPPHEHHAARRSATGDGYSSGDDMRMLSPSFGGGGGGGYARGGPDPRNDGAPPYTGKLRAIMARLKKHSDDALAQARQWRDAEPGDVLALIALGEALEARHARGEAARAYGSIIDLYPSRADLRRFAGERLERLGSDGLELAIDTFRQARTQRPDHPASHRLLAYALVRAGKPDEAFDVITEGAQRVYPDDRFLGVDRILREDVGLIAAAWIHNSPARRQEIVTRLRKTGAALPTHPSLRFVLNWETDANDVDFHIIDAQGGHAYFSSKQLSSGGELYADVTTGYGPECFTIEGRPGAYPYQLNAHYYSRGPMGYGMGKLEIIEHDGRGGLKFEERPFVIMVDGAFVDLGLVRGPLKLVAQN